MSTNTQDRRANFTDSRNRACEPESRNERQTSSGHLPLALAPATPDSLRPNGGTSNVHRNGNNNSPAEAVDAIFERFGEGNPRNFYMLD